MRRLPRCLVASMIATIELTGPITAVRLKLMPEAINLPPWERDE